MKKIIVVPVLCLLTLSACSFSQDSASEAKEVYETAQNGDNKGAICSGAKLYAKMDENSRRASNATLRSVLGRVQDTDWANDNGQYIDLFRSLVNVRDAGDEAHIQSISTAIEEMC